MAQNRTARRLVTSIVLLALGAGGVWVGLNRRSQDKSPAYRTEVVDRGDVAMTVTATGSLSAVTTVQVGSQVSGIVARLHADFNRAVTAGQLLAELDPTTFQSVVEQRRADLLHAEVQMRNAGVSFERQKRLRAAGLIAEAEYDAAKAMYEADQAVVDQARASVRQAETSLKYTKIVSPIDGVVVDRAYDVGQTVAASFQAPTLFTIAQDLTKMQVQADVDQSDIGRVQEGQPARFSVDAYPEQDFQGRISQIRLNATSNQAVITYPVMIEVANPGERLRPKMTANVTIEVARVANVLRVANAALRFKPPARPGTREETRPDTERVLAAASPAVSPGKGASGGRTAAAGEAGRAAGEGGGFEREAVRTGEPGSGLESAARAFEGGRRAKGPRGEQTLWVLEGPEDKLRAVAVRTGISDGRFTQVVSGGLQPGDRVVVGQVTAKVDEAAGRAPRMGGGRF